MARLLKPNIIKPIGDGIAEVHLTKGLVALVDEDCLDTLTRFKWEITKSGYVFSIRTHGRVRMHRFVLGFGKNSPDIDHINRNKLDNRRSNLRVCTHAENMCNRRGWGATSQYKGVRATNDNRWLARIEFEGMNLTLGRFETEVAAALAYDKAARVYRGRFAYQNLPTVNLHASHNHEDCTMERNAMCGNR